MTLEFIENKRENTVNIFQCTKTTRRRVAYYDKDKDKVIVPPDVIKELNSNGIDLKQYCTDLLGAYQEWERSNSPLRNLSKEQLEGVQENMIKTMILTTCFQEIITDLSVLNELDQFNEVAPDLAKLKESLFDMANKLSKVVSIDLFVEVGDKADEIMELLTSRTEELLTIQKQAV